MGGVKYRNSGEGNAFRNEFQNQIRGGGRVRPERPSWGVAQTMSDPRLAFWLTDLPQTDDSEIQQSATCRRSENRNDASSFSVKIEQHTRNPMGAPSLAASRSISNATSNGANGAWRITLRLTALELRMTDGCAVGKSNSKIPFKIDKAHFPLLGMVWPREIRGFSQIEMVSALPRPRKGARRGHLSSKFGEI